jgi:hypothetical protein
MSGKNEKLVAIRGQAKEPPVTQLDFARVARLQAAAWSMHTEASVAALELGDRISRNAEVEPGEFSFDPELRIVRSRKATVAPPPGPRPVQECLDFDGRKGPDSAGPAGDASGKTGIGS